MEDEKKEDESMKRMKRILAAMLMCALVVAGAPGAGMKTEAAHTHKWTLSTYSGATCTAGSRAKYVCTKCGKYKVVSGKSLGHEYITETLKATCTKNGRITKQCVRCGKISVTTIYKLGHDYRARKSTAAERKAYLWGTTLICRRCGKMTGDYADY